jgi:uncharacterized protein (TIGR02996 family)
MTSDERALLAAIVADPADDTVRLAYADCIEEQGNAARAAFIRLQIEADRLHPNSNARALLEAQAGALFAEHWIDWWGEVCAAVGFPTPAPKATGTLGRFARWAKIADPAGHPFEICGTTVWPWHGRVYDSRLVGWAWSQFRRGFPDALEFSLQTLAERQFLIRWPAVSPLRKLVAIAPHSETWPDGPHLAGVDSLDLFEYDPDVLSGALRSPHTTRLRELTLRIPEYGGGEADAFAEELPAVFAEPRVRQLERLTLSLHTLRATAAVANAPNLGGVRTLHVDLSPTGDEDLPATERLVTLARSPHLAGLQELAAGPVLEPEALRTITHAPTWKGLRKLILPNWRFIPGGAWRAFLDEATLPELEELYLGYVEPDGELLAFLVRSPLLKQLRHLSLGASGLDSLADADVRRLADIVDPERIETFALFPDHKTPALEELRKRFGDRLRMP